MAPIRSALNLACLWAKTLVGTHIGHSIGGAFAVTGALAASLLLAQDTPAGHREVIENLSTKFKYLNRRTETIERTAPEAKEDVKQVKQDFGKNRKVIWMTAYNTMTALSANKKPMEEFLQEVQKCQESGREGCGASMT
ncbi:hypothetical protein HOY80DRAFT_997849 [Tuber brumale]|nr:hypothetical protein HOY80DRAFT_997849 [Tuber brumale]